MTNVSKAALGLVGGIICLPFVIMAIRPINMVGPAARQAQCNDNLKQIGLALDNYRRDHGRYPPSYLADSNGKPMHSWRVLILKDLARPIYDAYDFSEPWDGPHNRELADKIPSVYICPSDHNVRRDAIPLTNYVAISRHGSIFLDGESTSLTNDRKRQRTIIIAESINAGIHWMAPRDLDVDAMSFVVNDGSRTSVSSRDPGGPAILLNDGSRERLNEKTAPATFKAMTTIGDGGETVDQRD
jgi:hypothetical protein